MSSYLISSLDEPVDPPDKKEVDDYIEENEPNAVKTDVNEDLVKRKVSFNFRSPQNEVIATVNPIEVINETQIQTELLQQDPVNKINETEHENLQKEALDSMGNLKVPVFYELKIYLKNGKNMAIRDRNGNKKFHSTIRLFN